ncbi:RNA polymerase sigma factor [Kitasatospora sp. NPDC087315]|uniref:RNA polymerase sigma factor n=1 Tax=Kitasatospora sp. NPDC087315 TaxID=3364069 RepID=UPI003815478E
MLAPLSPGTPAPRRDDSALTPSRRLSDAEILQSVRQGEVDAYGELFRRHHAAVLRYAAGFSRSHDTAADLTAEAFARVLHAVLAGSGPSASFLGYLLATLRRTAGEWGRTADRIRPVADIDEFEREPVPEAGARALADFENTTVARAFASLPERWRKVLWHTTVEGAAATEAAGVLGLSPSAVSALAYRAREGLRRAYLSQHAGAGGEACRRFIERFGTHARGGLGVQASRLQERHMRECVSCMAAFTEVRSVERLLHASPAPLPRCARTCGCARRTASGAVGRAVLPEAGAGGRVPGAGCVNKPPAETGG